MAPLLFSVQAFERARTKQHRTKKGQIFGSGLQLCASGAPAEPESVTPYRDQRHPHTVKMSSTEEGERIQSQKKKGRGEDKTRFILLAVNLGVARWKGHGSTPWHWALPRTFPSGCRERKKKKKRRHLTMLALFCPPSVMCHFLQNLPASVSKMSHPKDAAVFAIMYIFVHYFFGDPNMQQSLFVDQLHRAHDEVVLHMNNVIFGVSVKAQFIEQSGNLQLSKNPNSPFQFTPTWCTCWAVPILLKPH